MRKSILITLALALLGMAAIASAQAPGGKPRHANGAPHHACWMQAISNPNSSNTCCSVPSGHRAFGRHTSDLRPDADGDGIPNGRDGDFQRDWNDSDKDGICDHRQATNTPETDN